MRFRDLRPLPRSRLDLSGTQPGVDTVSIGGDDHQVDFRRVHPTRHELYLGFAMGSCRHIGRWGELEAMQAFWPDSGGRFPFEAGCDLAACQLQPRLDIGLTPRELRRSHQALHPTWPHERSWVAGVGAERSPQRARGRR